VALTLVLVVRAVNRSQVRPLYARSGGGWTTNPPDPDAVAARTGVPGTATVPPGVLLLHLDGTLYTGNAQPTLDAVLQATRSAQPSVHTTVVECSAVRDVTVPMIDTFRSLTEELAGDGVTLVLAGLPPETREAMARSNWFRDAAAHGLVTTTVDEALTRRGE
jgi:MFS superfamily sulfate permease-like transporter